MKYQECIDNLNHSEMEVRLRSLRKLEEAVQKGELERPESGNYVNNHIHTIYSFSPYSPAKAVWMAYNAGLKTAGIMDHDSLGGVREFIEAGSIMGIATTIGVECRADFSKTPLNGRRINNPDQRSIAYMALHGIPHTMIDRVGSYFAPFTRERNKRNVLMTENINKIMSPFEIRIDFEKDIKPISKHDEGGSITERNILFGLSLKLVEKFGKGQQLVDFIKNRLELELASKVEGYLLDKNNPHYEYDLLGALKGRMVELFYVAAKAECPDVSEVIRLCCETGAIPAYAYLGDITDSVTGDKKSQKFEDGYLKLLFDVIKRLGFKAATYMPSRNSMEQLERIKSLCEQHGLFQISGEDINSPRQSFICEAMRNPKFYNLYDSTWALIGHEKAATKDVNDGMFSQKAVKLYPSIDERVEVFKKIGLQR